MNRRNITFILAALFCLAMAVPAYGGALDGRTFTGKNGQIGAEASGNDEIYFADGRFVSVECKKWGFGDADYTEKVDGDRVFFTADIYSKKHGRITYAGVVEGETMHANYFWFDKDKNAKPKQVKWFEGSEKK